MDGRPKGIVRVRKQTIKHETDGQGDGDGDCWSILDLTDHQGVGQLGGGEFRTCAPAFGSECSTTVIPPLETCLGEKGLLF